MGKIRDFYVLRFLLGVFEAGFFPGVVFLFDLLVSCSAACADQWPVHDVVCHRGYRGRTDRRPDHEYDGRQGIPSVLAGIAVILYLPDKPERASWLERKEAAAISAQLEAENRLANKHTSLADTVASSRVWLCALIYFCIVSGNATIAFWTPSIIKELGVSSNFVIGLLAAIPFIAGTLAMVWNGWHSDRTAERRLHCAAYLNRSAVAFLKLASFLVRAR
jgi:hypothetical protein